MNAVEKNWYVERILQAYLQLPDTPHRINRLDRKLVQDLYDQRIPAEIVETAMLLAALRRKRSDSTAPLPAIRSLHYFLPIIREITASPLPDGYVKYLKRTAAAKLQ